jgi:hypothetical protein
MVTELHASSGTKHTSFFFVYDASAFSLQQADYLRVCQVFGLWSRHVFRNSPFPLALKGGKELGSITSIAKALPIVLVLLKTVLVPYYYAVRLESRAHVCVGCLYVMLSIYSTRTGRPAKRHDY